jgi:dipeptide/tripeptide permease
MKQNSSLITVTWIGLNLVPLILTVALCLLSQSWGWSLLFILLYVAAIVPYGFFVALPFMVKFFDHAPTAERK